MKYVRDTAVVLTRGPEVVAVLVGQSDRAFCESFVKSWNREGGPEGTTAVVVPSL